jgi:hypothetical protein
LIACGIWITKFATMFTTTLTGPCAQLHESDQHHISLIFLLILSLNVLVRQGYQASASLQYYNKRRYGTLTLISGFHFDVDEISAVLGNYAASSGNCLPTFRDNVSALSSRVNSPDSWPLKVGLIRCPETSVNNYHTTPRNFPEQRRSHLYAFVTSHSYSLPFLEVTMFSSSVLLCSQNTTKYSYRWARRNVFIFTKESNKP